MVFLFIFINQLIKEKIKLKSNQDLEKKSISSTKKLQIIINQLYSEKDQDE